ncbi:hypothetical protein F7734_44170 [Scytonema sp. UIC 10036]|uniref:hypothetical protein n=1 Tax=Scytonema sp. UIC 10036 TaxID=2304196 RepID=UPI0012DA6A7B|nr:hypothetical protein [Scytonema sp. UIC 10036]MUG98923.1 hypothetical protein [Scytonema sp. UIC 10036]
MFTKNQLELLIELQSDDWHPEYFRQLVQECGGHVLVCYINRLSVEQIQDLQIALTFLAGLPDINNTQSHEHITVLHQQ